MHIVINNPSNNERTKKVSIGYEEHRLNDTIVKIH